MEFCQGQQSMLGKPCIRPAVVGFAPADAGGRAAAGAKPGSPKDLQEQLDNALRENRHLREQRDILEKTLGILSEPSTNAMTGLMR